MVDMDTFRPHVTGLPATIPGSPSQTISGGRGFERLLTGTWALRLLLPGLVAAVGLLILWIGDTALRRGLDRLAQARFDDQVAVLDTHLELSLARAQARMQALETFLNATAGGLGNQELAHHLYLSMEQNPAIAWLSVATTDGRFRGLGRDQDGFYFVDSRPGSETRTRVLSSGILGETLVRPTSYDPRTRPHYLAAKEASTAVWTEPYTFFEDNLTGITCATPWRDAHGGLIGVLSLDFDTHSLGRVLRQLPTITGSRTYVVSRDGAVLGATGAITDSKQVLRIFDLADPYLTSVIQELFSTGSLPPRKVDQVRIAARPITVSQGLTWQMITYADDSEILAAIGSLRGRAALVALAAIIMASVIGWLVADVLGRVRRERSEARAAAKQALAAAQELGAYRLVKQLGSGGMGEVWKAEHRQLARPAAIKLMRAASDQDVTVLRERFTREAKVIAGLHSRHTVGLYDYGIANDGALFYVMELLDGFDLDQLVASYGPVPPARAVAILRQACLSLAEAHDQGLVHRDIKPANNYLCRLADEVDVVKVLDFGLVLASKGTPLADATRLSMPGTVFGTPTCMAPEQARGLDIDRRADLYALGCVMWWLLTGEMPFQAPDAMSLLLAHVNEPLPDLAARRPDLPAALVALVHELLAKDPAARPADARVIIARLRLLGPLGGEPWDEEIAHVWWLRNRPLAAVSGSGSVATQPNQPAPSPAPTLQLSEL